MMLNAPDAKGQTVTVTPPDPTKISYMYDWNSIFANPTQESLFVNPFSPAKPAATTGNTTNAQLLNMFKGA